MSMKESYRDYARYWLAGDDLRAGRTKNFATKTVRKGLAEQIETLYAAAASRQDVEDIELEHFPGGRRREDAGDAAGIGGKADELLRDGVAGWTGAETETGEAREGEEIIGGIQGSVPIPEWYPANRHI